MLKRVLLTLLILTMLQLNKVYCCDANKLINRIPDNTIDLTITSPPYDSLRHYNGYNFYFEMIAKNLFRITKPGGIVVWVVNDQSIKASESLTSFYQAIYFVKHCGFNLHDTMGYCKENPMPARITHKRYAQQLEYVFVLSKGFPKTFNPLYSKCKYAGTRKKIRQRLPDGSFSKKKIIVTKTEKIKGNLWFYNVGYMKSAKQKYVFDHPAVMHKDLAHDHILSWSNPGDIIFDPMCGSGTTLCEAKKLKRNFIGCDMSKKYCAIVRRRIKEKDYA